jgi:hypothetical protein
MKRLASGASRVMALTAASGLPGCLAVATVSLSQSAAERNAAVTSVIVRDSSVAASIARSATSGPGVGCGGSMLTCQLTQSAPRLSGE